jgi:hypothetical protein
MSDGGGELFSPWVNPERLRNFLGPVPGNVNKVVPEFSPRILEGLRPETGFNMK